MTTDTPRIYYTGSELTGQFIGIVHGETQYHETTVFDQQHADTLNRRQGIEPHEVKAAKVCSMFDCWDKFDQWKNEFSKLRTEICTPTF